jgi:hypothetical protein
MKNGTSTPLHNGDSVPVKKERLSNGSAPEEQQRHSEEDVSSVLSNVLDEIENNVDTAATIPSDNNQEQDVAEPRVEENARLENAQASGNVPLMIIKEEVSEVMLTEIKEEITEIVEDADTADKQFEIIDFVKSEPVNGNKSEESVEKEDVVVVQEKEVAEKTNEPGLETPNLDTRNLETSDKGEEPVETTSIPSEPAESAKDTPKAKKSKSKKATPETAPQPSPLEELDSVVSKCVSNMCDVLESVDNVVSDVDKKEKKTASPKSKSKKTSPKPAKDAKLPSKVTASEERVQVDKPIEKEKISPLVQEKVAEKKKDKAAKFPPQVPTPIEKPTEKAKRKPRKKKQQPLVAPVLPFPAYFPPPPMMAPQPQMPINFNFPPPIPVDLSVGKKKVRSFYFFIP